MTPESPFLKETLNNIFLAEENDSIWKDKEAGKATKMVNMWINLKKILNGCKKIIVS